ncbi:uncharacterized protein LOC100832128 isoform X1 [Brachypodium distachyon]|uniref:PWWP domain-containing protein n=1 Tax=Brachypodium distachyon TaxID=15368 RepID=A0A0Q3G3K7_BRADI|nr:uncharacterized protein LOC100832128 isoform X1 [Brachypodium distachyon]KQK05854.1 hypothetical protein BRADI_2g22950v3 [Brachypodium distachyon]KQK05855.1 hypothetical protein BRADI_2g22950v3 [Brachypodium distachyon]|eukprot:XP_014754563.1 uncharacterized protein LOC100832128 isoform X1 [Brachypodium distachyon]
MSSRPAASDPGGDSGRGGLKQDLRPEAVDAARASSGPAGDSDVAMAEASEEVVAGVKVEGAAVARRVGALTAGVVLDAAAATDPLYATESAGMVISEGCGDESIGEAQGRDGETEARASTGEPERKPVASGDVAVTGEVVVPPGSAATEHAGAASSELEENHVNASHTVGNTGNDNGEAHFDEETQNGPANSAQCARYCLPLPVKDGFQVSDLVWGKVKSHPWWPGEIFDHSDASELALKHQKKGNRLVAYFGDSSFAWCDESQLKPFVTNYSQMEKQSSSDAFVSSVNYALEELSRRILSGMSCACLPEELSDNGMSYMVENAGLKDGVTCSAVNRSEILACFSPASLLHYVRSLALFPGQGGDLLELVIACSQLTSFYRSKGCPELASFQTGSAWAENDMDTSPTKNVIVEEVVASEVLPSNDKPKRGRGRPRKQKPEDNRELTGKKPASSLSNNTAYGAPMERRVVRDDFDDLSNKKKRSLDLFDDAETKSSTPAFGGSFKIGECIRRAASQLTGSSSIVKSQNELTVYKNPAEADNAEFDVSSDDDDNEITVEKRAKRRRMHKHHTADPMELFSQLCSVATEPMDRYNFSAMIISYFSDYRNYVVSTTTEANIIEKSTAKRGRKRRVLPSPELETTDHMQDSYWSGLSLHNHPIHSLKGTGTNTRPRRRRRSSQETDGPTVEHLEALTPKKQIQVIERSIIHVDEKMVDEWKPTALVLSFGKSIDLPSETDLIKKFGRYGPLKESETEVHKSTNTVKIVFKKRADAERAFTVAGKYGTFGPSLRSYRLVNMPFSLGSSEANNSEACVRDEVPLKDQSEIVLSGAATGAVQVVGATEQAKKELPNEGTKYVTEANTENKVPEETVVPMESQAQSCTEKTVGQDATEQTMEFQAPNEASAEIPSDVKLEVNAFTEKLVGQVATEQAKLPVKESAAVLSDPACADTPEVQGSEVRPEAVHFQAACKTLVEQVSTKADTAEVLTKASVQESGPNKEIVESNTAVEVAHKQVCCVEKTVQAGDGTDAAIEPIDVGKQTAEDIAMAEVMVKGAVESKGEAPAEETVDDKTATETQAGETTKAETTTAEKTADDATVAVPDERNTEAKNIIDNATVEAADETAKFAKKTEEDGIVEALDEKATAVERTVDPVEALDEKATAIEDDTVAAVDEKVTTSEKPLKDAMVEAPCEKATADENPAEDATVDAPDQTATTANNIVEDAMVDARDDKATATERTVEDDTVAPLDKKVTTTEKSIKDEAPSEKATTDATVDAPGQTATTTVNKIVEDATAEAPKATTAGKTVVDATVEGPDDKAIAADEEAMAEAADGQD